MNAPLAVLKVNIPLYEAEMIAAMLEGNDIESFLDDEVIVTKYRDVSHPNSPKRIYVYETDLPKANAILKDLDEANETVDPGTLSADDPAMKDMVKTDNYCPLCNSSNVICKDKFWNKSVFATFFMFVYLFLKMFKYKHHCLDCGNVWKQRMKIYQNA